jgi:hypothetical protein
MRALTVVTLTLGLLLSVTCIAPPAAAQAPAQKARKAELIKKPQVLGSEVSTVTSYRAPKDDGPGVFINCRATCTDGPELHWRCPVDLNVIQVHCVAHCSPPPAHGMCFDE